MKKSILLMLSLVLVSISYAGGGCSSCEQGMSKIKSERFEKYNSLSPEERKALKEEKIAKFKAKKADES